MRPHQTIPNPAIPRRRLQRRPCAGATAAEVNSRAAVRDALVTALIDRLNAKDATEWAPDEVTAYAALYPSEQARVQNPPAPPEPPPEPEQSAPSLPLPATPAEDEPEQHEDHDEHGHEEDHDDEEDIGESRDVPAWKKALLAKHPGRPDIAAVIMSGQPKTVIQATVRNLAKK